MLHQLHEMLDRQEYHECVDLANLLLSVGHHQPDEVVQIQLALSRSYQALSDSDRSVVAAEAALAAAKASGCSRLTVETLDTLAAALTGARQFAEAIRTWYAYLQIASDPSQRGRALEAIAGVHRRLGNREQALEAWTQASCHHQDAGDGASAQHCRRQAFGIALQLGDMDRALPLLTKNDAYVRAHQEDGQYALAHVLDWASFLLAAGEAEKAVQVAFQVLELSGDLVQQAHAHLLLCQGALAQEKPLEALGFAMAAKIAALDARAYSLEFEAAEIVYRLLHQHGPSLLAALDLEFQQRGVDLYQYISADWYWRSVKSREGGTDP